MNKSYYSPCDLVLLLQSATIGFHLSYIMAEVKGLVADDITLTAGQAMIMHQLRYEADDYDIHVTPETYERVRMLNPQLVKRECSLGESLNGEAKGHKFTIFSLGELETKQLIFTEQSSIWRVFTLDQLRKQKWQLLWMWDRSLVKKIQDMKDLWAIRRAFQYWRSRQTTPMHTVSLKS